MTVIDFSKYIEARDRPLINAFQEAHSGMYLFALDSGTPRKIYYVGYDELRKSSGRSEETFTRLGKKIDDITRNSEQQKWLLTIPAENADSFTVEVYCDDGQVTGWFGGLEQNFSYVSSAITWVKRAISADYQLRIISVGGQPREWYLEPVHSSQGGSMQEYLGYGISTSFKWLRKKSTHIKQNQL